MKRMFVSIFKITLSLNTMITNRSFNMLRAHIYFDQNSHTLQHNWQQTEANHHTERGTPMGGCGPKGCGFSAVWVINRVSILADFFHFGHE